MYIPPSRILTIVRAREFDLWFLVQRTNEILAAETGRKWANVFFVRSGPHSGTAQSHFRSRKGISLSNLGWKCFLFRPMFFLANERTKSQPGPGLETLNQVRAPLLNTNKD